MNIADQLRAANAPAVAIPHDLAMLFGFVAPYRHEPAKRLHKCHDDSDSDGCIEPEPVGRMTAGALARAARRETIHVYLVNHGPCTPRRVAHDLGLPRTTTRDDMLRLRAAGRADFEMVGAMPYWRAA